MKNRPIFSFELLLADETMSSKCNKVKAEVVQWCNGLGKHEPLVLVFKKMYECFRSDLTILPNYLIIIILINLLNYLVLIVLYFYLQKKLNNWERNCSLSTSVVETVPLIALFWPAMLVKGPLVE